MLRNILIVIPMVFGLVMGTIAFISPAQIAEILGVSADNAMGRGTIIGDFGAIFFVVGGAAALALFKGKSELLWIPIALFGITALGRTVDIVLNGLGEGALQPIIIELVMVVMLAGALKLSKTAA